LPKIKVKAMWQLLRMLATLLLLLGAALSIEVQVNVDQTILTIDGMLLMRC